MATERTEEMTDSVEKLEEALNEIADLRKRSDLDQPTRDRIEKAARDIGAEYLAAMSPAGHAAWEAERRQRTEAQRAFYHA
jgi:hypothetical protein